MNNIIELKAFAQDNRILKQTDLGGRQSMMDQQSTWVAYHALK